MISWLLSCGINSKDAARYAASFASKGCDHPEDIRDVEDCDWPEIIKPVHSKKIRRRLGEEAGAVGGRFDAVQSEGAVTQLDGSLGSAESGSTGTVQKYESVVPTMVFGQNDEYRGGLLSRTGAPERSVRLEFAVNDGGKWMLELEYVDRGAARESYPSSKG